MLRNRNLRKSIRTHVQNLLEGASSYGFTNDFNVYDESDMRAGTSPVFPWVYLIDSTIKPTKTTLPFVVLETRITKLPFEIGNRSGRIVEGFVHVFGSNRGQRDDLASMIQDYIGPSITVYNYSTGSGVADGTKIEIDPLVQQFDAPSSSSEIAMESGLQNLSIVTYTGVVTQ